jgi:hypothetical protein
MCAKSTIVVSVALAASIALSGCAEFYPYVDPTVRSSDFLFRDSHDRGETRLLIDRSYRRDECNRLQVLSRQPTRQALCYVDAKHDEIVSNIRAYTWGHRILSLTAAGAAVGAAAVGIFGGSRDLAVGLGLGAASAYGLDSIANVPAYARSYWAGLRGLQCVRGAALEAVGSVLSLSAIRYELVRYQRALQQHPSLPQRTNEFDRLFGRIRSLQVEERSNAVGIVQAADRIVSEVNRQVALNEPSSERIMQIARGIAPMGQQLGGIAPAEAAAEPDSATVDAVNRATDGPIQNLSNQATQASAFDFIDTRLREIDAALPTRLVVTARITDCRLGGENEFRINPDIDTLVLHPGETYRFVVSGGQGSASAALSGSALSGVQLVPSQTLGAGSFELKAASDASGTGDAIAVFQDQSGLNQRSVIVRLAVLPVRPFRQPERAGTTGSTAVAVMPTRPFSQPGQPPQAGQATARPEPGDTTNAALIAQVFQALRVPASADGRINAPLRQAVSGYRARNEVRLRREGLDSTHALSLPDALASFIVANPNPPLTAADVPRTYRADRDIPLTDDQKRRIRTALGFQPEPPTIDQLVRHEIYARQVPRNLHVNAGRGVIDAATLQALGVQ